MKDIIDVGPTMPRDWIDERDVDYRLQKAYQLIDNNIWIYPEDQWVDKYLDFVSAIQDEQLYNQVQDLCPDIYQAVMIYDCRNNEPISSLMIECGALAGGPIDEVADQLDLQVKDVVTAYEKIFFDVRERTDKSFFVLSKVLKSIVPLVQEGIRDRRESTGDFIQKADIWRLAAWKLGWENFKSTISFNFNESSKKALTEAVRVSEGVKRLYASLFEDINVYSTNNILTRTSEDEHRTREIERRAQDDGGDSELNEELIKTLNDAESYKLNIPLSRKDTRPSKEKCLLPETSSDPKNLPEKD